MSTENQSQKIVRLPKQKAMSAKIPANTIAAVPAGTAEKPKERPILPDAGALIAEAIEASGGVLSAADLIAYCRSIDTPAVGDHVFLLTLYAVPVDPDDLENIGDEKVQAKILSKTDGREGCLRIRGMYESYRQVISAIGALEDEYVTD